MDMFKIKKISIIFITLLLLSGCNVQYNITINEGVYEEGIINVRNEILDKLENNSMSVREEIEYSYKNAHDLENEQDDEKTRSFNLEKIENISNTILKYSNNTSYNLIKNSIAVRQCYDVINVYNISGVMKVSTNDEFKCFNYYKYLENVKIVLNTNYNVISNNADEISDNQYIWNINKNNYKNKSIQFELDKDNINSENRLLNEENSQIVVIFLVIGLLVGIFIFGFMTYYNVKNSNK